MTRTNHDRADTSSAVDWRSAAVAIVGPTASGKSALALAAARRAHASAIAVELVAVDAMQVYRGMDIGTAKPTAAERAEVVHHGLDLFEPSERGTVAQYCELVEADLTALTERGTVPLLVGGTGLYVRALVDDLDLPGEWPAVRAALERDAHELGSERLHCRLADLDPAAAAKIEPGNARRLVRALEVCLGAGRTFSSFGPGLDRYPPTPAVQLALRWRRAVLAARIAERVHAMIASGLVAEVEHLLAAPHGLSPTARQALGYKEIIEHLEGRSSLDQAIEETITRTRQFATRQERWFRRDPRLRWVSIEHDPLEALPELEAELDAAARRATCGSPTCGSPTTEPSTSE